MTFVTIATIYARMYAGFVADARMLNAEKIIDISNNGNGTYQVWTEKQVLENVIAEQLVVSNH